MTASTTDPAALRADLVADLSRQGALKSGRWANAFGAIPREVFVDEFTAFAPPDPPRRHRLSDPAHHAAALAAVYSDTTLATQWDAAGVATSSSTCPSLMALMLEALGTWPGHRVLEIGTGTGYNAALLCHVLGQDAVTSIDIHPELNTRARAALTQVGHQPTLVVGDGADGVPERGRYDRLIATCGFTRVPAAWLDQVVTGGLILVNLSVALVGLTRNPDGSAHGRFGDPASFMARRTDITDTALTPRQIIELASRPGPEHTHPTVGGLDHPTVTFLRQLQLPGVEQVVQHRDDANTYLLVDPATDSWARATTEAATVASGGPRDLWLELVAAVSAWHDLGQPEPTAYSLHVAADGTHTLHHDDSGWATTLT